MPEDLNNKIDDSEKKEKEVEVEENKAGGTGPADDDDNDDGPIEAVDNDGNKLGFPANTRRADMTIEEQAAYWKYQSRKHEKAAKQESPEVAELRAKIAELEQAQLSEEQKATQKSFDEAVAAARAEAIAETEAAFKPQMQQLQFEGFAHTALKGHQDSDAKVKNFVEFVDMKKFVGDDGLIDGARVQAALTAMYGEAKSDEGENKNKGGYPNFGQGSQLKETHVPSSDFGRAMAAKRFPKADK